MHKIVRNGLTLFLALSLLIHLSVWVSLNIAKSFKESNKKEQIEIVVLDQSQAKKMMQIVEQNTKPINDEVPEDAKYLSAHNQKVVRETKAKNYGDFRNSAGLGGLANEQRQMAKAQKQKTKSSLNNGQLPTLADLRPKFDVTEMREVEKPSTSGAQASQTNDHLKDQPSELETLLSTREFVYYTYYQRIRTQIRQYWEPSIRHKVKKIFAQGRSIASEKDHVTRVIIVLNKQGQLTGVQIVGESGYKDLDDAAVEAFRAAEPFPNPPKGIIEKDGTIRINWDFILEANNSMLNAQRYARNNVE